MTMLKETTIDISIAIMGWILSDKSIIRLTSMPKTMAATQVPTYLIVVLFSLDQISDSKDELTKAEMVENAAPSAL
jgi:hypothetical protein